MWIENSEIGDAGQKGEKCKCWHVEGIGRE